MTDTTERDEKIAELLAGGANATQISVNLGVARSTVRDAISRLNRQKAAVDAPNVQIVPEGFHLSAISTQTDEDGNVKSRSFRAKSGDEGDVVPETGSFPAPDGMYVRSVSTLVDGQTGTIKQQWVKADKLKSDQFDAIERAIKASLIDVVPVGTIEAPGVTFDQLATLYTLTDSHVGMLAWKRETGEPWDLRIAEEVLVSAMFRLIDAAPESRVGILNNLGDFLHFDSLKAVTPEHGHLLDADSRYQKVVEVATRIIRRVIARMLEKHELVYVLMNEGNHDPASSVWLRTFFAAIFAENPRVTVETSPLPYVIYEHGKTLLAFHHGHLAKPDQLPLLIAAKFSEAWGRTSKRYIHGGHRHHVHEKEFPGVKFIQHATLAAADAYAARGGWLSERQAVSMTYHMQYGEVARNTVVPEMEP